MSDHKVTATWEGWVNPHLTMTCTAPADADCHARFDCDCEAYTLTGVQDGIPWHAPAWNDDPDDTTHHFGRFDPESCTLRDWFDSGDHEDLAGSVTFDVTPEWQGDYYTFEIAGAS